MTHIEALKALSDELVLDALRAGLSELSAATLAYYAGYAALMKALSPEETAAFDYHPNPAAARIAAQRLKLHPGHVCLAEEGLTRYSADPEAKRDSSVHKLWASRARAKAGWEFVGGGGL